MALNQQLFQQRLAAVRAITSLDARAVDALAALLQDPDDWKSFRINPIAFAERLGLPTHVALDVFLHAARAGLLELRFNVVCPGCGGVEYQSDRMDLVPEREWHCATPAGSVKSTRSRSRASAARRGCTACSARSR